MSLDRKPNDQRLTALVDLVQAVNACLNKYYLQWQQHERLVIANKLDESPITEADLAAHDLIELGLLTISPEIPVLSEESSDFEGRHQWQTFWLVDPLDGTREFIHKTGEFTVNIALIAHGQAILNVIGVPTLNRIYIGHQGGVVYRVDIINGQQQWQVLNPLPHDVQRDWRVAITRRSDRPAYNEFKQVLTTQQQSFSIKNAGSAYKFCLMLEGEIDVYPRLHPTSEWDTASGQGLLEMIGGGLFDLYGRPFRYNQRAGLLNGNFIAVRHTDFLAVALAAAKQAVNP